MKLSQSKDYLPLIQAAAEGKTIQYCMGGDWADANGSLEFTSPSDCYRIKPEPRLRPWKPEEVPVGALINMVGVWLSASIILCADEAGIAVSGFGCTPRFSFEELTKTDRRTFTHSLDGGKTWLPCGVEECA